MVERTKAYKTGHPLDPTVMMGAQASQKKDKIFSYIKLGKRRRCRSSLWWRCKSSWRRFRRRLLYSADYFKGHNKMRIFQEEILPVSWLQLSKLLKKR